ncbi:MAG: outer membrane lipoprotein-sorting protein [Desulfobacterales bacterium]|nr:outer membrane lipoprotein-sorting protein [Desulfobacterales bacterium]
MKPNPTHHAPAILAILTLFLLAPFCSAAEAPHPTGRDIMVWVDEKPDGDNRISTVRMTLVNRRGRKRIREMSSWRLDEGKDTKKLMRFKKPADVEGTAFLSWDYDNPDTEDDRWLYMPALRNTRRISGKANDDYFMGTDFTYDDMGDRNVDEDTHTLLREETVENTPCWVVSSVPVDPTDMYTQTINWIGKETKTPLKKEYYDKDGLLKTYTAESIENIDGFWTVTAMRMENHSENHKTLMRFSGVKYNTGMKKNLFRVNALVRRTR